MQRFRWEPSGGYIACMDDSNLVFAVNDMEGKVVDVVLKRRNPDDVFQRWVLVSSSDDSEHDQHRFNFTKSL